MSRKIDDEKSVDEPGSGTTSSVLQDRRNILKAGAVLVSAATLDLSVNPAYAESTDEQKAAAKLPPQTGDRIQIVKGELKNQFVKTDSLELNAIGVEAFPYDPETDVLRRKNRLNRLVVLRLDPEEMDEATREKSADGLVAYSAMCTHRNCTIQSWMEDERHLRCHCHLSEFAALSEGSVKSGPARKQLPMVPIGTDDEGFIVALDGFTRKPGGAKK